MFFQHNDFLLNQVQNVFGVFRIPKAAGTPESGTGTTKSAFKSVSFASSIPKFFYIHKHIYF